MAKIAKQIQEKIEAAAFRRLISHLQKHTEIQNIDLMINGRFCRNCFSKWIVEEAQAMSEDISLEDARNFVYGMPYDEWKAKHQKESTPEQQAAYNAMNQNKH